VISVTTIDRPIVDNVDIPSKIRTMTEILLTALLSTDFDGHQFEKLTNGYYSMSDDENTIVLVSGENWEVLVNESLCITGELVDCIDWISEYLG
jgi:hypothetical protein